MKKIALVLLAFLVFGGLSWAKDRTFTGVVSDSHCGAKHSAASPQAQQCVEHCVSNGAKYVLVSEGKVYQLDAQDKFKGMGGKEVTVTGSAKGNSITVTEVKEKTS
jgi:predicted type IV restriction endonuclease